MTAMRIVTIIAALALSAGCDGSGSKQAGEQPAAKPEPRATKGGSACVLPQLDLGAAKLDTARADRFVADFRSAHDQACREGMFAARPLVDPRAGDPHTLFVLDAPNANAVSIYFNPEAKPPRMILEAPFGSLGSPSIESIHEAMFCALRVPSDKEIFETGRCLVD